MTGTGIVSRAPLTAFTRLRLCALAVIALLALGYELYVLSLAARPRINWERQLYYLDHASPCYVPPGALDVNPGERLTFEPDTAARWRARLGHGWQVEQGHAALAGTLPATIHLLIRAEPAVLGAGGTMRLTFAASAQPPRLAARVNGQPTVVTGSTDAAGRGVLTIELPGRLLRPDGRTTIELEAPEPGEPPPQLQTLELDFAD
ncbi:MAG: hypothetical protein ACOCYP_05500 [Planctomycetota bacterium]